MQTNKQITSTKLHYKLKNAIKLLLAPKGQKDKK